MALKISTRSNQKMSLLVKSAQILYNKKIPQNEYTLLPKYRQLRKDSQSN